MKNILVLAPHADDETLGCGGTIAKHVKSGDEVNVAILTNASVGAPELFGDNVINQVRDECSRACQVLGVNKVYFENLPAPQLDQYPQYKIANCIRKIINDVSPSVLYIPHKGDLHMDHGAIYNAALVAARPFANQPVLTIYSYETLSETEWGHPTPDMAFIPTVFNDISGEFLEKKLLALKCYVSQLRDFPSSRSLESITALAKMRGSIIGAMAAESFALIRSIDRL